MADIFVSYAREDVAWVTRLVSTLQRAEMSVFWDLDIRTGDPFRKRLELELNAAKCVLVVWSAHSLESNWVIDEASVGASRRVLMPVIAEKNILPPLGLRAFHAIDLSAWSETREPTALPRVLHELRARIAGTPGTVLPETHAPSPGRVGWYLGAGVVAALAIGAAVWASIGSQPTRDVRGDAAVERVPAIAPLDASDAPRTTTPDARKDTRPRVVRRRRDAGAPVDAWDAIRKRQETIAAKIAEAKQKKRDDCAVALQYRIEERQQCFYKWTRVIEELEKRHEEALATVPPR